MSIARLMKTPETMKGRKLLIRLHETNIEKIRPDGLYIATATIKRYYTSTKRVDIEYVVEEEKQQLQLEHGFYQKDCTPVPFLPEKRRKGRSTGGVHCGWAMYREGEGIADIGEDVYELMEQQQQKEHVYRTPPH